MQGVRLAGGWYAVLTGVIGLPLLGDDVVRILSRSCEVVRGSVEDNEMVSAVEGWKDGCKIWSVVHDPAEGDEHLESQGELPDAFVTIRDRLRAAQAAETGPVDHIFDIPVELAKHLTGYHPDENIPGAQFETLAEMSWFARVFKQ